MGRRPSRTTRALLLALATAVGGVWPLPAAAAPLFEATLRDGDYGAGAAIDTVPADGDLGDVGIVDSPAGVTFVATEPSGRSNALINWVIPAADRTTFRTTGTVSFCIRASRTTHATGSILGDNYGFGQFNNGQGAFGAFAQRVANGPDPADDQWRLFWHTWHDGQFYDHAPAVVEYDRWYRAGFTWGGATNQFEIWVDGVRAAFDDLPAGLGLPWGAAGLGTGSATNFGLGDNHERGVDPYNSAAGVTIADIRVWKEYHAQGDTADSCVLPGGTLTVIVDVINDHTGTAAPEDVLVTVTGGDPAPASFPGAASPGVAVSLDAGDYLVSVSGLRGYTRAFSTDCAGSIGDGETRTCTVTLDDKRKLTALGPVRAWVGLAKRADIGIQFDLQAKVYVDDVLVAKGEVSGVTTGSRVRFSEASLTSIPLTFLNRPVLVPPGAILKLRLLARNACAGSSRAAGSARLWFDGAPVDSEPGRDAGTRFHATIGGAKADYFLRAGGALSQTAGAARRSKDISVGSPCGPFTAFGGWRLTLP